MPRHVGKVFLAGPVVNQADDQGPHGCTPLFDRGEARPSMFPGRFAGRPKWFHGSRGESAHPAAPIGLDRKPGLKKICAVGLEMCVPAAPVTGHEIPSGNRLAGAMPSKCELVHNRARSFQTARGFGPALTSPIKVSSPPLQPGGFFFYSCEARPSAGSPSPAAGFEVRPIPSAGKVERPIAVRTVFGGPGG